MRRHAVALLEISDLTFGYTDDAVFENVTFRLEAGDRASLVAPNGFGKTTLLRVIAGELSADRGSVVLKKDTQVGYCRQSHELPVGGTVGDVLFSGFEELLALRAELADAQRRAASGAAADLNRLAELTDRHQDTGADQLERRVEMIASRLGFAHADLDRPVVSLSGGERGRLQLGLVLANEPALLLLDEPTNHLDLDTIRWLEPYLVGWKGAVLVVSHDRAFLDAVCPITLELGRTSLRAFPLPYSSYHEARAADLERERKLAEQQAAFVAKTEDFVRRNLAGQKTKQAQSRRKMLSKLQRTERPEDVWAAAGRVRFQFAEAPRSGDIVLEAHGLGATRGGRELFTEFDLLVRRGDRIGIVGPNGCGKTTLLSLLAGLGNATDQGNVRRGANVCDGYFDQHLGTLDAARTCVEEIRSVRGDLNTDGARQYLARFRFYGEDPLRPIRSLSGGELTRLALAKLLMEPRNLLFLDEPTNHLDIPATEILEEALTGFPGSAILISHDRRFLETVTTRTVSFHADKLDLYEGSFLDYVQMLERRRAAEAGGQPNGRRAGQKDAENADPAATLVSGAERHRARREAARRLERQRRRVTELERAIAKREQELAKLRQKLQASPTEDWERLHEWATQERELSEAVERLMTEWARVSDELTALDDLPEDGP